MPSVKGVFGNKKGRGTILVSALLVLAIFTILANNVSAVASSPSLGAASSFAVLGASAITNVPTSQIKGDVGEPSGSSITGLTCAEVTGNIYDSDAGSSLPCRVTNPALLTQAHSDLVTAYNGLSSQACDIDYGPGSKDLVGLSLVPGVYCAGNFALSGTLTLVGSGAWIFKAYGASPTLVTTSGANVVGGDACNVWWRVASSATLGSGTELTGNILALASITLVHGATLNGKALVQTGAVTLDANHVTASNCPLATTITTTITTTIGGIVTTIVTTIVLFYPPTPKVVAPVPVGGVMLPSVGFSALLPWVIALSLLGVLSVEAFTIKRRAKRR